MAQEELLYFLQSFRICMGQRYECMSVCMAWYLICSQLWYSRLENVRHEMSICFILCSTLSATNDFRTPLKIHNNCVIFVLGVAPTNAKCSHHILLPLITVFPPFFLSCVCVYRNTIDFIPTSISKRYTHCLSLIKVLRTSLYRLFVLRYVLLFFGAERALSKPIKLSFFLSLLDHTEHI